jgi:hypothetical protein
MFEFATRQVETFRTLKVCRVQQSRANYTQTQILRFRTEEEFKSDGADDLTCRKGPRFG